jgi:putative ABC transport system permease protein
MPADFRPPAFLGTDVWSTMQTDRTNEGGRGGAFLRAVGRLANGASLEQARQQASQLGRRLEEAYPETNTDTGFNVYPLQHDIVQQASTALWTLFGAVGFVLLIACVNVANLLLARGAIRQSELAVRVAMGAGRRRILTQLMTESLMLAGIGGALGIALSFGGTSAMVALAPTGTPLLDQVAVDGRILGFAAGITMLAGVLFGILPSLGASRTNPVDSLRDGGRSSVGGRFTRLRNVLVVGQVGLALMLLVGAGLLVRSFENLQRVDLGFEPDGVLAMQIQLPGATYPEPTDRHQFFRELTDRLNGIPGVQSAGSVSALPLAGFDGDTGFQVEGTAPPASGIRPSVWFRAVTPGYFQAMELELLSGRTFTEGDDGEATLVIMVNETMERDHFDGYAVGKRVNVNGPEEPLWREVVGVVRDIKNFGIRADSRNALYVPYQQFMPSSMFTVVKASAEPQALMNPVRAQVAQMDPSIAVARMQPLDDMVDASLGSDRFTTSLLGGFAMVALILAVVGLYGVVSYSVSTRMQEMGVRIALGAPRSGIQGLVLTWSLKLAAAGILIGVLGSLLVTRLMEGLLFGVGTTDMPTFGMVASIMGLAAVLSSMIPAIRSTRVDPIQVLKTD